MNLPDDYFGTNKGVAMRLCVALALSFFFVSARAADVSDSNSLLGKWEGDASKIKVGFTFYKKGEFLFTYTKANVPVTATIKGAFDVKKEICFVGGNLWLAADSARCCFRAYFMNSTLVLDQVQDPREPRMLVDMPLGDGAICQSRTFVKIRD